MKQIFIDSSALVALINVDDDSHAASKRLLEKIRNERLTLITTDYVFDETVTTVLSHAGYISAANAGNLMLNSSFINFVWIEQEIKLKAWEYFVKHDDKGYSFTDCTSFVLMKEMNLKCYLAFDKHFEQAGFRSFL